MGGGGGLFGGGGGGGGSRGGGSSTTTVQQEPPQLLPEAKPGFEQAQGFYRGVLASPPIYTGPRVAPTNPTQTSALNQAPLLFGQPSPASRNASQFVADTTSGRGFTDTLPQAVQSAAQPLFMDFVNRVIPGIRDSSQLAGQGVSGTRRDVANEKAVNQFGQALATGVVAPLISEERRLQLGAAEQAPKITGEDIARNTALFNTGSLQRGLAQEEIDAQRQAFEEPLFRQSGAAQALLGAGITGPGGATSTSFESPGVLGTAQAGANILGQLAILGVLGKSMK